MSKYNAFLTSFVASIVAFIVFIAFYLRSIFSFALHADGFSNTSHYQNPFEILGAIFSPGVIISFIVMAVFSVLVRVLGIVYVAKNKTVTDGEKALWIVGFVLMGFVTAIVFLILAKGKKFVD